MNVLDPMYMHQQQYLYRNFYTVPPPQPPPPQIVWRRPPVAIIPQQYRNIEIRDNKHPRPPGAPIGSTEPGGDCWNNAVVAWEQRTMIHNKIGLLVNER